MGFFIIGILEENNSNAGFDKIVRKNDFERAHRERPEGRVYRKYTSSPVGDAIFINDFYRFIYDSVMTQSMLSKFLESSLLYTGFRSIGNFPCISTKEFELMKLLGNIAKQFFSLFILEG